VPPPLAPLPDMSLHAEVANATAPSATTIHRVVTNRVIFMGISPVGTGFAAVERNGLVNCRTWAAREQNEISTGFIPCPDELF
jgi:hypothetical protein